VAGTDFQFNQVKGRIRTQAELAAANDAVIVVPLEATGLEADGTLKDYDDLAALLAGTSNEQTVMGRKTLTALTIAVDDVNDWVTVTLAASITWTAPTGNPIGKLLFCYDADTTAGTDANVVPMLAYSFDATPDGLDIVVNAHANGLIRLT
jgi:hypothetical protein